jgi:hypothetical protein
MKPKEVYIEIACLLLPAMMVHGGNEVLTHEWERGSDPSFTVETKASVNTDSITGSGRETIPVSRFILTFMLDGAPCRLFPDPWNRNWQEADQDKVAPEYRITAVYKDGVFRNFNSGSIPLVPPAVWNGEWVVLQMPGPTPMLSDWFSSGFHGYSLIVETDPPNRPPVADASNTVTEVIASKSTEADVTLDGSLSYDPDGDALTYSWSENGTEIATGEAATVTLPVGEHTIGLSVDDGNGGTDYDEVTITVKSDRDGDGVPDDEDAFPDDPAEWADTDGDGVGDNADQNDNSDLRESVVVGGSETGVANQVDAAGLSIQDHINQIEGNEYRNLGQYVATVAHCVEDLLDAGAITQAEADIMMCCAAQSDIGKTKED